MPNFLKIVTYNIQFAKGKDEQIDVSRIANEIADADIIALQEVDRFWSRSGDQDQIKLLQTQLSEHYSQFGAGVDIAHPNSSPSNQIRRQFGNAIFSRYPIEMSWNWLLPKEGGGDALSIQRSALEAQIRIKHQTLRITSTHLTHLNSISRITQTQYLMQRQSNAVAQGHAVGGNLTGMDWQQDIAQQYISENAILLGDFNCLPESEEYCQIVGSRSDYGGRVRDTNGFIDAWVSAGHDTNKGFTSDIRGELARLDYAFLHAQLAPAIVDCYVDNDAVGSDHQPLWLILDLNKH